MTEHFAGGHLRFVNGEWRDDNGDAIEISRVRHGRWDMLDDCANAGLYCSACGRRVHHEEFSYKKLKSKYCPHCGARMDGGKDDEAD